MQAILGLSCFYHDSAAALIVDGEIVAAAQEERFSRKKHDPRFPKHAVEYCLKQAGLKVDDLAAVAFYDKPLLTFERILLSFLQVAPRGLGGWLKAMPLWLGEKLYMPDVIRGELNYEGEILFTEHHESHAASAFYPSPFREAAILTVDGVGEWATASYGIGRDHQLELHSELRFPDSLGLLYSAFTYFTGFRVNSGEYKLMGLAPYGEPKYVDIILDELIDLKDDGSLRLNMKYFDFLAGKKMTNARFAKLFDGPARRPEAPITQREMDLAASIQKVTEEAMLRIVRHVHKETGMKNLCLAGGVALNCVANGRIIREGPFDEIWIQPAAGDAGGALGAAQSAYYRYFENKRKDPGGEDQQFGSYLGPRFDTQEVQSFLSDKKYPYRHLDERLAIEIAQLLSEGKVVGYLQGRMEFGPRALGGRSILGDPRSDETQTTMNLKIKFRESFRPFAPSVLEEEAENIFEMEGTSPYMLLVANVQKDRCLEIKNKNATDILERLKEKRSDLPAITHLDYTARLQTVSEKTNSPYHQVLKAFQDLTGCPVVVNTSFNVRGEPIVCSLADAYRCFMRTDMDALVLEDCLLMKGEQPAFHEARYQLDEVAID